MRQVYHNVSALSKAIAEKRRRLFERQGGIMRPQDLAEELGLKDKRAAQKWAKEHDVPMVEISPTFRGYEVDLVAKAIVQSRGMCQEEEAV